MTLNHDHDRYQIGLVLGIKELRRKVPDVETTIRFLHADGNNEPIYGPESQGSSTENDQGSMSVELANLDGSLAGLANSPSRTTDTFTQSCGPGIVRHVKFIFAPDLSYVGSLISAPLPVTSPDCNSSEKSIMELIAAHLQSGMNSVLLTREQNFLAELLVRRDVPDLLDFITREIQTVVWQAPCSLFLWNESRGKFILAKTSSPQLKPKEGKDGYAIGDGLTGWVGKYGKHLIVNDPQDDNELAEIARAYSIDEVPKWSGGRLVEGNPGPTMIFPLNPVAASTFGPSEDQTPIGIIRFSPQDSNHVKHDDLQLPAKRMQILLHTISYLVAGVLESAKIGTTFKQLQLVEEKIFKDEEWEVVLNDFLNEISRLTNSFSTHIRLWDSVRGLWYFLKANASEYHDLIEDDDAIEQPNLKELQAGTTGFIIETDVQGLQKFRDRIQQAELDSPGYANYLKEINSTLVLPIRLNGSIGGAIHFHRHHDEPPFHQTLVQLLQEYIPALENFIAEIKSHSRKNGEQKAEKNIDWKSIRSTNRLFRIEQVLLNAISTFKCDLALIRSVDAKNECLSLLSFRTLKDNFSVVGPIPHNVKYGEGCAGRAWKGQGAYLMGNSKDDLLHREQRQMPRAGLSEGNLRFLDSIESEVSIPMHVGGEIRYVLVLVNQQKGKIFRWRDIDKFEAFADRAALILAYVDLGERNLKVELTQQIWDFGRHQLYNRFEDIEAYLEKNNSLTETSPEAEITAQQALAIFTARLNDCRKMIDKFQQIQSAKWNDSNLHDLREFVEIVKEDVLPGRSVQSEVGAVPLLCRCADVVIAECLRELIKNAESNSPLGTCIRLGVERNTEAEKFAMWVEDEGCGFSPEYLRLFESQEVVRGSKAKGGLGLHLIQEILILLHGKLIICNHGNGAKVVMHLPENCFMESDDDKH